MTIFRRPTLTKKMFLLVAASRRGQMMIFWTTSERGPETFYHTVLRAAIDSKRAKGEVQVKAETQYRCPYSLAARLPIMCWWLNYGFSLNLLGINNYVHFDTQDASSHIFSFKRFLNFDKVKVSVRFITILITKTNRRSSDFKWRSSTLFPVGNIRVVSKAGIVGQARRYVLYVGMLYKTHTEVALLVHSKQAKAA